MTKSPSTIEPGSTTHPGDAPLDEAIPALMIAWSADEPTRAGEVAIVERENAGYVFGRGDPGKGPSGMRLSFCRQRPGESARVPGIESPSISREQLRVTRKGRRLHVERVGRCPVLFRGEKVDRAVLAAGDAILLKGQLLLYCTERPRVLWPLRDLPPDVLRGFAEPDAFGLIGESPVMAQLRDAVAFNAKAGAHALVLGPSGAGKELVARAVHQLSSRARGPFVARNAATLPVGLLEAELFGNVKNYPNPGMPERPGLVGAAEGGTLFLDEIGDLAASLHAGLLRLLDGDGEYHRLGEAKARRANLRLVGATNRAPEALKHDLLARLPLRLPVPGLDERRDDIPLLMRHLLRRALEKTPELVERFTGADGEVRVGSELVEHLLRRPYTTHVRELEGALWRAMAGSRGMRVELPEDMAAEVLAQKSAAPREEPTVDEIRASVAEHGGNLVRASKALGLPSRYALYRLLRKHGIDAEDFRATDD